MTGKDVVPIEASWMNIAVALQVMKLLAKSLETATKGKRRSDYYNDFDLRVKTQYFLTRLGDLTGNIRDISRKLCRGKDDSEKAKHGLSFLGRVDFQWNALYHLRHFLTHGYLLQNAEDVIESVRVASPGILNAVAILEKEPEVAGYLEKAREKAMSIMFPSPSAAKEDHLLLSCSSEEEKRRA